MNITTTWPVIRKHFNRIFRSNFHLSVASVNVHVQTTVTPIGSLFLDRSRLLCLYRVLKRMVLNYGKTRFDMPEGCRERFDWSFLQYVYHFKVRKRDKILEKVNHFKNEKNILILRNNKDVRRFLSSLNPSS